jgi:glycosyltransferase involved in cell wall biosynthesis
MSKSQHISAVIITKNEEKNILTCLRSLVNVVDEIIVLDSGSTDQTVKLCKDHGAIVHQVEWLGYAQTKNHGNALATHDYILSIDADEELSQALATEILTTKTVGLTGGYLLDRHNFYKGKWIRWAAWHPDYKLRLFNKQQARWVGDFVHEKLVLSDSTGTQKIEGALNHYSIQSKEHHIATVKKYAKLAAERENKEGKNRSALKSAFSAAFTFIKIYFFKFGILEGTRGFSIALYSGWSKWLRYKFRIHKNKKR